MGQPDASLARLSTGRRGRDGSCPGGARANLKDDPTSPEDLKQGTPGGLRPGRRAEAIALLEPLERSGRLGPGDRFILARACLAEGLADRYRGVMGRLLEDEPNDVRYLVHFLGDLIDRGELDEAGRRAAEAIGKGGPAAGLLRPKLAAIYCRQGRYDEAEALFRSVLRDDPGNVEALNNLAWELALREPGEPREVLCVDRGHPTRRADVDPGRHPGRRPDPLGRSRAPRGSSTMPGHADPKNASLALHLAWAYQSAGKTDEARRALRQAEELGLRLEAETSPRARLHRQAAEPIDVPTSVCEPGLTAAFRLIFSRNLQCSRSIRSASCTAGLVLALLLAAGHGLKADEYTVNYNYAPPYVTIAYTNPSNPSTDVTGQGTAAIPFSVKDTTTGSSFTGFCVYLYHDQYSGASYSAPAYSVAALAGSSILANAFPYTAYTDLAYRMNYMGYVFVRCWASLTNDAEVAGAVQLALWTLTDKNFSFTTTDTKVIADTNILLGLLGGPVRNGVGRKQLRPSSSPFEWDHAGDARGRAQRRDRGGITCTRTGS